MSTSHAPKIPRYHRDTLIEMNFPVYTARRDAAHARAMQILREDIPSCSDSRRVDHYAVCERLLDEAIHATRHAQLNPEGPLLRYFQLLRDTLGLNLVLLRHELTLDKETRALSKLVADPSVELHNIDEGFCASEGRLLGCIESLLTFGEPLLQKDAAARLKTFSGDDRRRYDLARKEYDEYFRKGAAAAPRRHRG